MRPAARGLIGLWVAVAVLAGGGSGVLALLGPPRPVSSVVRPGRPAPLPPAGAAPAALPAPAAAAPSRPAASPSIAAPDAALLEPAPDLPGRMLPRIGADGRRPADAYAGRPGAGAGPRIAILVDGLGLSGPLGANAIDTLPAAIAFAVSPYAAMLDRPGSGPGPGPGPEPLLDEARRAGHELWLSLPMEPARSPLDEEGPQALSQDVDLVIDRARLDWSLSRFGGYVGITNLLSGLHGDRFAGSGAFAVVVAAVRARGLLYADAGTATPMTAPPPPSLLRAADLVLDEAPDAPDIEARLTRLEEIARARGSAFGVAGPLRPVLVERLRAWSRGLAARGLVLVPPSAMPAAMSPSPADPARSPS